MDKFALEGQLAGVSFDSIRVVEMLSSLVKDKKLGAAA